MKDVFEQVEKGGVFIMMAPNPTSKDIEDVEAIIEGKKPVLA